MQIKWPSYLQVTTQSQPTVSISYVGFPEISYTLLELSVYKISLFIQMKPTLDSCYKLFFFFFTFRCLRDF